MFNVYKIVNNSVIYGPNKRSVIWFRGCSIRCKDCINQELWNRNQNSNQSILEVLGQIQNDDITFLGGEPLDQEDIELLIDELKKQNKGIILFTGYSINDYDERKKRITSKCDIVISEPFMKEFKDDKLYLRGSSNQIVTINTNRYSSFDINSNNSFEIDISEFSIQSMGRNKKIINDLLEL